MTCFLIGCLIIAFTITASIIALQRGAPAKAVKCIFYMVFCLFIVMGSYFLITYEDAIIGFCSKFLGPNQFSSHLKEDIMDYIWEQTNTLERIPHFLMVWVNIIFIGIILYLLPKKKV